MGVAQRALRVTLLQDLRTLVPVTRAGRKTEPNAVKTESSKDNRPEAPVPESNVSPQRIRSQSRSKDRKHNSKGQTWTMTSDSDLPSDVSVETASHHTCWLIPITVDGVQTLALLVSHLRLQMHDMPQLE